MSKHKKTRSHSRIQSAKEKIQRTPVIFDDLLSTDKLQDLIDQHDIQYRDRLFSPMSTLWIFINQILSADHSCRAAVAHYLSILKKKCCSLSSGGYCQARGRLKESFLKALFLLQVEQLQSCIDEQWLFKSRRVKLVDGTTVSMPDTLSNQKEFPAANKKKNRNEFPIARLVVIICKTTGVLINAAIGTYQGKGSGETSLLKELLSSFNDGDICVFDRYYAGFFCFSNLMQKGVDCISRQQHLRKVKSFKRIGKNDFLFNVKKPQKPKEMSQQEYEKYPAEIALRKVNLSVRVPGFRTRKIEVITSLIDKSFLAEEITELYKDRWFVEVDLRSIKSTMGMGILRCKTAEMVRKEIWVHFLTYNLIRAVIIDSARKNKKEPRDISFKAAQQIFFSFRNQMAVASRKVWDQLYFDILDKLKNQIIGHRPNRYEPRLTKRRQNIHYLTSSRKQARRNCLKQGA